MGVGRARLVIDDSFCLSVLFPPNKAERQKRAQEITAQQHAIYAKAVLIAQPGGMSPWSRG